MEQIVKNIIHGISWWAQKCLVALLMLAATLILLQASITLANAANGKMVQSTSTTATTSADRVYTDSTNAFAAAVTMPTGGIKRWIVDRASATRNEHITGHVSSTGVLYIQRWNGTTWSNEWNVTVGGTGVSGRRFDIAYETTTGNAMVVYSTNTTTSGGAKLAYRVWNGTSWSAATTINSATSAQTSPVAWVKLKANPKASSNEIAVLWSDAGLNTSGTTYTANTAILSSHIWNGTAWTEAGTAHTTATTTYVSNTTAGLVANECFDLAYESLSGDLLVVFTTMPTTTTGQQYYRTYSAAGTWGTATSYATGRVPPLQMVAASDPLSDKILVMWNRPTTVEIYGNIWSGTAVGTTTTLGTNGVVPATTRKTIAANWLIFNSISYPIAFWQTGTTTTMNYRVCTNSTTPTWATAGTLTITASARFIDTDVDPANSAVLMLSYADSASDLYRQKIQLTSAAGAISINNGSGMIVGTTNALTTTLATTTAQSFDFAYDRYPVPVLVTPTVTSIGITTATLGATVSGSGLTAYGIVWSPTDATPTIGEPGVTTQNYGASIAGAFSGAVSSLPAGTRIYYAGYATNSLATTYSPIGSFYTEPATQASNVTFSNVLPTAFTVNWTKGATDGVLVLIRAGAAPTGAPVDGTYTTYTATAASPFGTAIGDGNVIYKSTGSSVNVTGLTNGTTYYVAVFSSAGAANTAGFNIGTNYKTVSPATGSFVAGQTIPVIGALNVTPLVTTYTSGTPTVTAAVNSAAGEPTGCEFTVNNGSNWEVGSLSGTVNPYTCTAQPQGLDGSVTLNIRATNSYGTGTGSALTYTADGTLPTIATQSPADGSKVRMENVILTATVSDIGSGLDTYRIIVLNENQTVFADTGWLVTTGNISYVPAGLSYDKLYYWDLSVRDKVGNVIAADQRMVGTYPACVRNSPAVSLSTAAGEISSKIAIDAGSSVYVMKVTNNDSLGCTANTFTLTATNNAVTPEAIADKLKFNDPSLAQGTLLVQPGAQSASVNLTVSAKTASGADVSGVAYTTVDVTDGGVHATRTTNQVLTVLNVAGCTKGTPILNIGPDTTYAARGGSAVYSVSIKNTDYGANCAEVTYNLSKSDSNTSLFSSTLNTSAVALQPGQAKIATLKVTSTSAAINGSINTTTIGVTATGHTAPADKTAKTTIGDMMIHNSDNLQSTKWSANGGWGVPGTRYGEFTCGTCHVTGGGDTKNIGRLNETIFTPHTTAGAYLPLQGKAVAFGRVSAATKFQPSFGWDNGRDKTVSPVRICQGCHTDDLTSVNGTKFHSMNTDTTRASHYDGKDCIKCHKHKAGFGLADMACNMCHGNPGATDTSAAFRFEVAPPVSANGQTGTLTGTGLVSNNPKVGAHQTHMQMFNGLSDTGTFDDRCMNCHGSIPINTKHMDGTSVPKFQGLANHSTAGSALRVATSWSSTTLTCSTYCHNPSKTNGTLAAANAGTGIFPSWTSAKYLGDTRKTDANCGKCHKVPSPSGFSFQGSHSATTVVGYDCSGCHGHNGDTTGTAGQKHMDGIRYAAGYCNSCHSYDNVGAAWGVDKPTNYGGFNMAIGKHYQHIAYIKARTGNLTLDPVADSTIGYGVGKTAQVCGVCHTNVPGNHMAGGRTINFGDNTDAKVFGSNNQYIRFVFGTSGLYNGNSTTNTNKTCSNLSCHYFTTPSW